MTTYNTSTNAESQIRQIIADRAKAMQTKDLNFLMANYSPEIMEYDAVNPLQYHGIDEATKRAKNWFDAYQGSIGYEIQDLKITAGDEVAFCHFIYRITGTMTSGSQVDMWVRDTICCQKIRDKWVITHEHTSVPFEAETGKASMNLKP